MESSDVTPTVHDEIWITRRLQRPDLFAGLTTSQERLERLRRYLVTHNLQFAQAGRHGGNPETWAHLVRRVYGVPLCSAGSSAPPFSSPASWSAWSS